MSQEGQILDSQGQDMFRPPVNRAMRVLDRSFFKKDVQLAAARIFDVRAISRIRSELTKSKDILLRRAVPPVQLDPSGSPDQKCIILRPEIAHADPTTWPATVTRLASAGDISLVPFLLRLEYDHWPAYDILQAVLPEELHDDIPSGFNPVGHIAHFNLRPQHMPFKSLIGEVTIDKNAAITTVVNKVENLGESRDADMDEFRVLPLEVIAGPASPDFNVDVREASCQFRFDFSKVFWNSRLGTEHERLVQSFKPGEAVCDLMAGVGPFAIPAGKKGVFVWANDLNPHCHKGLQDSIAINKVGPFVTPSCEDGHTFVCKVARQLWERPGSVRIPQKQPSRKSNVRRLPDLELSRPRYFSHFVMNLPASAMDFVPDFVGLYDFLPRDHADYRRLPLPVVHCYCFGPKLEGSAGSEYEASKREADRVICEQLSERLGVRVDAGDDDVVIRDVRNVAPNKSQFCASFRLPEAAAYTGSRI